MRCSILSTGPRQATLPSSPGVYPIFLLSPSTWPGPKVLKTAGRLQVTSIPFPKLDFSLLSPWREKKKKKCSVSLGDLASPALPAGPKERYYEKR
ncbi:hypothetical protein CCUS01_09677 [Colletotrichum cuscutae]|uniref:Uncharacterized protein n=1 Tax=Colletotrichum cuscutae TaxID=1209917 RepID=A0AAI9XRJ4_9PEZI|nr:hypothetical protein CCUS01_09677 [Colletotrichum cuscutae]